MSYVSGRLYSGQLAGLTTTPVPLSTTHPNIREILIQSSPSNAVNVLVGTVQGQYLVLTPGQGITVPIISPSLIYVAAASSTVTVNWLARD